MTEQFSPETLAAYAVLEYGYTPLVPPERKAWRPPKAPKLLIDWREVPAGNVSKVYLVRCGRYVKIGRSVDIASRLRAIQSLNPHPLKLVALLTGGHELEQAIHRRFAYLRHQDEWFRWDRAIALWIKECARTGTPAPVTDATNAD